MQVVPVQPIANQTLQAQLGGQATTLHIYQLDFGLFIDVYIGTSLVVCGVICENLNRIIRSLYLGFSGDLIFVDTTVNNEDGADPVYTGLGTQFLLLYLAPEDLPGGEG
jgi:hypothetical protein